MAHGKVAITGADQPVFVSEIQCTFMDMELELSLLF